MIQQAHQSNRALGRAGHDRSRLRYALLWSFILSAPACAGPAVVTSVPRQLEGRPLRGAFVPPFAYEAFVRGELALSLGQFEEAVAQYELATAAPEEDTYLLSRLAYAQFLAGRPGDAEQTLSHAERLDACAEAVWLTRGELHERAEQLDAAATDYARAASCAPESARGPTARARVLERAGQPSAALEALGSFSAGSRPAAARIAFEIAIRAPDAAALAHALETWLAYQAPDAASIERAIDWALAHGQPLLAERLSEHHPGPLPRGLASQLLRASGDREQLLRLLEQASGDELGGARATAELALSAGAYERAELEATGGILREASDALLALRAEARLALGRSDEALSDLRAIKDEKLRREALLALLARSGSVGLSRELAASQPPGDAETNPASAPNAQ